MTKLSVALSRIFRSALIIVKSVIVTAARAVKRLVVLLGMTLSVFVGIFVCVRPPHPSLPFAISALAVATAFVFGGAGIEFLAGPNSRWARLDRIKDRVAELAARIDAPASLLPSLGHAEEARDAFVACDGRYHYVSVRSGAETGRRTTDDEDELLYWIFSATTRRMTERKTPAYFGASKIDQARLAKQKQLSLLAALDEGWERRWREQTTTQ